MEPLQIEPQAQDLETGMGMDPMSQMPQVPGSPDPSMMGGMPMPAPTPEPVSPLMALLNLPGADAVRRVYQLALSAARAKAQIRAHLDQMDARSYHAALSASPEARYADDLTLARRELDVLAQERRRLTLEAVKAREAGRPASIYELQAEAATRGMEAVALGVLLFLAMPEGPTVSSSTEEISPQ